MAMVTIKRFSVWGVDLDPTKGSEQSGFKPVLVLSPDVMNNYLNTVIVAPMTTSLRGWPTRVQIEHQSKIGEVALDQLRTIDKIRLKKNMGLLKTSFHQDIYSVLAEIFSK
ncbi:type II toxin-antitoxin system PemK/MazF family toxin [Cysteiniphilum halobium]|uniref:type II toxin-antitoxin system PemK/MazF family toxin n=1 Tax=Cysteiniphilum halobium TaxID=2219059 RepID=UPI000E6482FC|nr:type II toxin-antitoxin system PemK/MazF family toxin [Cysteiniphilum halobium]